MLSEARSLAVQHPQYQGTEVVTAVFQILVDFSQTSLAMQRQERTGLALLSAETSQSRQEVYGFRCSTGLDQGLDVWVESLERRRRQPEMRAWRLRLLEGWNPPRATGLLRRQERMSLVQAEALNETTCSFGRTLRQTKGHSGAYLDQICKDCTELPSDYVWGL